MPTDPNRLSLFYRIPLTSKGALHNPAGAGQPSTTPTTTSSNHDGTIGGFDNTRPGSKKLNVRLPWIKKKKTFQDSPTSTEPCESDVELTNNLSSSISDEDICVSNSKLSTSQSPSLRRKVTLKLKFNWRKGAEKKENSFKPSLSHVRSALTILAGIGDGLAPVPGLKGAAGIALEIVRVVEMTQNNKKAAHAVAVRAFDLVQIISDPPLIILANAEGNVPSFIGEFENALVQTLDAMKSVALEDTRWYKKIFTCESVKEKILDCNNLLNQHVERFQVAIALASAQSLETQRIESSNQQKTVLTILQTHEDITMTGLKINVAVLFFLVPRRPIVSICQ